MTWRKFFDKAYNADNQEQVIEIVKQAVIDTLKDRKDVGQTHGRQASYNLLLQTINNIKSYDLPNLHVKHVVLAAGIARLRAPIVPRPSQLKRFEELWAELETLKKVRPNATTEVFGHTAAAEYKCYALAESLLKEFKPLCDPLNPQLTEDDIAAFWEDC